MISRDGKGILTPSKLEKINQMIADLYDDSVTLSKRMEGFFAELYKVIFFEKANFLFYQKQGNLYKTHSIYTINWNDEQKRRYECEYCHLDDVLSILDSDQSVSFLTNQMFNQSVRKNSPYFQEFLLPMGLHDSIETNFSIRNQNLRGVFSIHRSQDKNHFTEEELEMISLFQPHFSNALKDYGRELDMEMMLHMLNSYHCVGVSYFDKRLNFLGGNTTYRQRLAQMGFQDLGNNPVADCFRALSRTLDQEPPFLKRHVVYKMKDTPLFLEVTRAHVSQWGHEECYVCLFFDLSYVMEQILSQMQRDFGLTEREMEVLHLLLRGFSNEQISASLFVSVPTVKKHLAAIYSKLEIKNQKQILEKLHFYTG
ncbi:MAG: helix-turn-helix transcriptional regulator [Lawsonibacter sp.]|nr:helix-turn-helix transcriptional regulator [Lawsonibacter sp.]